MPSIALHALQTWIWITCLLWHVFISGLGCCAGKELWDRLQWSFGDKQAEGFTYQGTTKKYPVLIGEWTLRFARTFGASLVLMRQLYDGQQCT